LIAEDSKSKVVIRPADAGPLDTVIGEMMDACRWQERVPRNAFVVLKPNLCASDADQWEMSDTDVRIAAAVCRVLHTRTRNIVIGEADHLRHKAWQGFEAAGYLPMAHELRVKLVNFSELPTKSVLCEPIGHLALPTILLDADAFITLPVLKTHSLTYFTGALKNQWGCVPQYNRILLHKHLDQLLVSLQRILHPAISIMDGIVAMEGRGPVNGKPRRLDLLLASDDPVALDATAMRLVGLEPKRARHVLMAAEAQLGHVDSSAIAVDGDWTRHRTQFEPAVLDSAQAAMNYLTRYRWFVKFALENDYIFRPGRSLVHLLRRVGLVEGA
jgi:uncharacterized protein (DUF362 family)